MHKSIDEIDDEEEETYFCCFRIGRKKKITRSNTTGTADKMSMQHLSYDHHSKQEYKKIQVSDSMDKQPESPAKIAEFPKNKLFFLKNKASKEEILAKITEKHCSGNELSSSLLLGQDSPKSPISDQLQQIEYTPENVARYIAKRLREFVIVTDLGCGAGGNTVQLAKECDYVVGVEIDRKLIELAEENCKHNQVEVDLINADIFMLNNLKTDVIFVNPNVTTDDQNRCRDLLRDCNPSINKILLIHQKNTKNFVFQLPPYIDISQLPLLLNINSQFTYYCKGHPSFCYVEIEQIYVNRQLEYLIVYCGEAADIKQSEIVKFLAKSFRKVQQDYKSIQKKNLFWLFDLISREIGIFHLCYRVTEAIKQKRSVENFCKFVSQNYQIHSDLYSNYKNQEDIYSVSKQEIDQQDLENMSPSNFSYKQIEVTNMQQTYNDNIFDVFDEEESEEHHSFVLNIKH